MSYDPTPLWVLVALANLVVGIYMFKQWRSFRAANPGAPLNFRLIELWSASLAMSPTLALFAALNTIGGFPEVFAPLVLVLLIPHQCAGSLLIILCNSADSAAAQRNALDQFVDMFSGTLFGLFMPFFSFAVVMACLFVLGILIQVPIVAIILIALIILKHRPISAGLRPKKETPLSENQASNNNPE